jgi:hypothetical protein
MFKQPALVGDAQPMVIFMLLCTSSLMPWLELKQYPSQHEKHHPW